NVQQVGVRAVELTPPEPVTVSGADKLYRHPKASTVAPHTPVHEIRNTERAPDRRRLGARFLAIARRRDARFHVQTREVSEPRRASRGVRLVVWRWGTAFPSDAGATRSPRSPPGTVAHPPPSRTQRIPTHTRRPCRPGGDRPTLARGSCNAACRRQRPPRSAFPPERPPQSPAPRRRPRPRRDPHPRGCSLAF